MVFLIFKFAWPLVMLSPDDSESFYCFVDNLCTSLSILYWFWVHQQQKYFSFMYFLWQLSFEWASLGIHLRFSFNYSTLDLCEDSLHWIRDPIALSSVIRRLNYWWYECSYLTTSLFSYLRRRENLNFSFHFNSNIILRFYKFTISF